MEENGEETNIKSKKLVWQIRQCTRFVSETKWVRIPLLAPEEPVRFWQSAPERKTMVTFRTKYCEPKVGVGVIVCRGGKVLLGKRKGSHGEGEWSLPGGHLDPGEELIDCCIREVLEETDIDISDRIIEFEDLTNDLFPEDGLHYVTLFYYVEVPGDTEAKLMEETKCEGWKWFRMREAPMPLFKPLEQLLKKMAR